MRGDLVYQRVMDGRVIKVLRDELGRTYAAFTLCHDGVCGVRHCLTDIAEVAVKCSATAVLEVCAVFENLRHKPLRDEYKV
jgi:hypothetical protein